MRVVIDSILFEISSWVLLKKEFSAFSLDDMLRKWTSCISIPIHKELGETGEWIPPAAGKVKINFDEVSFGNPGLAGYRCVMRDSQGVITVAKGGPIG